jgi:3-hydroxyacyl-CoA dehydrogenase
MSPFFLLQLVGPAVALHVGETLAMAYPGRFGVSPKLRALVAAGTTAVYRPDLSVDPSVAELLAAGDGAHPRAHSRAHSRAYSRAHSRPSTAGEVRERALEALAEEIRLMLDEGVVAEPEDIDLCMILGAGWPFHLGGITPYLDRSGIAEKVTGTRFHL